MKFRILLQSFEKESIKTASEQLYTLLSPTECTVHSIVALPTRIKRFCVLRSPHVDKDSREHFEVRLYKRIFDFSTGSPFVLDILLNAELPSGIACTFKILSLEENQ